MTSFRERVNSHLPIVLQLLSTLSLLVIAATAICGSQSLKKLAASHTPEMQNEIHKLGKSNNGNTHRH